jgi:hypothetical protein
MRVASGATAAALGDPYKFREAARKMPVIEGHALSRLAWRNIKSSLARASLRPRRNSPEHRPRSQAIAQGLNEGGDLVRARVQIAMKNQTSLLRLKSVTSRQREIRAFPGHLS